jgi:hypothetical protein
MRLQSSIKIDEKEYNVRELTVKEIIQIFSGTVLSDKSNLSEKEEKEEIDAFAIIDDFIGDSGILKSFIALAIPNVKIKDLIELAPSELMKIWDKIKEVNPHFFVLAQQLRLGEMLTSATIEVLRSFLNQAVSLSKLVMEKS